MNLEYEWHDSEQDQATSEGWAIWNYPEAPEIQRLDEEAIFTDDHALIQHLTARAFRGDPLARKALVLHWGANAWAMRQGTSNKARSTPNEARSTYTVELTYHAEGAASPHDALALALEAIDEYRSQIDVQIWEPDGGGLSILNITLDESNIDFTTRGKSNDVPRASDVEPPRWIKRYVATVQLVLTPDDALDSEAAACDAVSAALTETLEASGHIDDWAYLRVGGQYMGPSLETVRNLQHPDFEDTPASMLITDMDH